MKRIPNALPGKDGVDLNIFGMTNVPRIEVENRVMNGVAEFLAAKRKKLITEKHE